MPPARLLRLHRHSLSNLLVLGGTEAQRLSVARAFHDTSPLRCGPFVALDCARDESRLGRALQAWLVPGGFLPGADSLSEIECGTLYLDSVGCLSATTQRLLLSAVRRLQGGLPESGNEPGPFRLAVGNAEDLAEAVEQQRFSSALYDCLDKVCVRLGRMRRRGAA